MKILIAEDDKFFIEKCSNLLKEYLDDITIDIVLSKSKIQQKIDDVIPDIIIMDLIFPDGESIELISEIKSNYPETEIIISSSQSNIRVAVNSIHQGADHYIVKDDGFKSDLFLALNSILDKMKLKQQITKLNESIFDPENYPLVIYKASETGVEVVDKDFIDFPERLNTTDMEFLHKIGLNTIIALGQGHTYAQGCYNLPAGESEFFELFIFALIIPDPYAADKRLKKGYYQIGLFVPNSFCSMFPSTLELSELIPKMKEIIPNAENIKYERLSEIKELILNFVITTQFG